jgi:cytochrome d ubiquinol oxidase subunit I
VRLVDDGSGRLGSFHLLHERRRGQRLLLWTTFSSFPLPFIATLTGWFTAEVGRQPWSVYGVLRTADAVSPILTTQAVTVSLLIFGIIYVTIFGFGTLYVYRLLRAGPAAPESVPSLNPKRPVVWMMSLLREAHVQRTRAICRS